MCIRAITDKHRSETLTRLLPASRSKFAEEFAPWLERQRYPILFPDARNGGHNGQIHRDAESLIALYSYFIESWAFGCSFGLVAFGSTDPTGRK